MISSEMPRPARDTSRECPLCHYYLWNRSGFMVNHRTEYVGIGTQLLICFAYPSLRRSEPKATAP